MVENKKVSSIAFVGSTLPILFIKKNIDKYNIEKLLLSTGRLKPSYNLIIKNPTKVEIDFLPKNIILRNVKLIKVFFTLKNKKIIFFHESGWFFLDLLILLFKPNGYFAPQTNMKIFKKISNIKEIKKNYYKILYLFFNRLFNFFYEIKDHGLDFMYMLSVKKYPSTISNIKFSNYTNNLDFNNFNNKCRDKKKILFLLGTDSCSSVELKDIYKKTIGYALDSKFLVFLKDHPNPEHRLNLEIYNVKILDPNYPAELLKNEFDIVVTHSSASIRFFMCKKISILKLITTLEKSSILNRKKYLCSISKNIIFSDTLNSFKKDLLRQWSY